MPSDAATTAPAGGEDREPRLGDTMRDTTSGRVGRVMGFLGPYVQLRPLGGGREWDAQPERLRPATSEEILSAGVAAANTRSRGEQL
ncbi:hypothetical protein ABZZ79_27630 [Streptomyces sp. NPDC006458]|uniref:hypothetical protein n=1 Tax=Streptomyces sp. NPDC006458 TaxID=3154302 RepID=UPI0033A1F9AB